MAGLGALGIAPLRMGNEFGFPAATNTFHRRYGTMTPGVLRFALEGAGANRQPP
ncbi:MAG TPA: hypothetical protein VNF29_02615 [Candidatus Binataceae bacterium]|nr:hypothetical protein [Candidatus Binataceae bacterium]